MKSFLEDLQNIEGLTEVNKLILNSFQSEAELLSEISNYLFALKGKQIRPILCLLSARACGLKNLNSDIIKIAAGIELIHLATILHDDIIDNSDLRRNKVSANKKYGINRTLLAGDFLLVRAFGLCGELDLEIVQATEQACIELTEGEILETALYNEKHDIDSALNIAKKKTAALFKLATFSAAKIAGCSQEECKLMASFGENLGISFQILDDILDVSAEQEKLGKPIGTDLREQKPSVINIFWLESGNDIAQELLREQNLDIEKHLKAIQSSNAVESAKQLAIDYARKAEEFLNQALDSEAKKSSQEAKLLNSLIKFTINRSK